MSQAEGEQKPFEAEEAESSSPTVSAPRERLSSTPEGLRSSPPRPRSTPPRPGSSTPSTPPRPRSSAPSSPPRPESSAPSSPPGADSSASSSPHAADEDDEGATNLVPIQVMRVIAIGRDDGEPEELDAPNEIGEEIGDEDIEEADPEPLVTALRSPDSEATEESLDIVVETDAVEEEEVEAVEDVEVEAGPPRPPPPKPRGPSKSLPPRPKARSQLPQPPATRRRPWWEHLFGDDFARAYRPLTDEQVRSQADFIEHALGVPAGAVVLDLCCGQGQQAVELASRGYGVVGYDLSVFQLAIAAENAQARQLKINFLQGDAREMAFDQMFDAVLCWDTSFGYFEEEKNFNVAERIYNALRPGGVLLLDVLNRDYVAVDSPTHVWFEGDGCICMDDVALDWITSRLRVKRSLILDDGRSRELNYSLRLYSLHELGKLLHDVGFRVTQASGDLTTPGVFLGPHSPRIIIRAQKPG